PDAHSALREEPAISDCLAQGVDLVCSSGDKLLGGPQAGLIVGRHDLVEKIRRNPLMRAMRVDKMVYAALDATLLQYAAGRHRSVLPVWSMLQISDEEIRRRVEAVQQRCSGGNLIVEIEPGYSYLGGGSAPGEGIPTWLLALQSTRLSARSIEEALRRYTPPILTRIEKERVLLDLRTVFPDEDEILASGLLGLAKSGFAEAHESSS
ncbi:MAG TPA: L-seryl-tRNA(Sec) selenium transferase, partial [Acidobacteriota bacterium]|nr:L-seryl-tRNA(Sec) selenium transferase [Acidobacteriota bacterium]